MRLSLAVALLVATPLLASPTITSISPGQGPVTGGTPVTVRGFGFSATGPFVLTFGGAGAASVRMVDANTITAMTPQHLPGPVTVSLSQPDGSASMNDSFVFTGNATDAFDRLLLPLFVPPIYGAYGSQFVTNLSLWNATLEEMTVYGLEAPCSSDPCVPAGDATLPSRPIQISTFQPTGTPAAPGKFIYVPKGSASYLTAELRVEDVSRQSDTWGTHIPVVADRDMRTSIAALLDIPTDSRFRNMLRVYGDQEGTVQVRIVQTTPPIGVVSVVSLPLTPGATMFDPSYASFSAFPLPPITTGPARPKLRVEIEPVTYLLHAWAFVSVTNNETQQITVIAPH
jgi:hypothetical protein